jgi:hypothetical protein
MLHHLDYGIVNCPEKQLWIEAQSKHHADRGRKNDPLARSQIG